MPDPVLNVLHISTHVILTTQGMSDITIPFYSQGNWSTERWLSKLPMVTLNRWARIGMWPLKYYIRSRHSVNICRMNWRNGICKVLGKVQPQCWHSTNTSWLSFYLCLHVWKNRRHIIMHDFCLRDLPSCWGNMNKKDNQRTTWENILNSVVWHRPVVSTGSHFATPEPFACHNWGGGEGGARGVLLASSG